MKRLVIVGIVVAAIVLLSTPAMVSAVPSPVTIDCLNCPKKGMLELAVGESRTFYVEITSDEPFTSAMGLTNAYYPGRGIFWHGGDIVVQDTYALLELTMTGKGSTADLWPVSDWPESGYEWPEGTAPVSIATGVRFAGGEVFAEQFAFAVVVP